MSIEHMTRNTLVCVFFLLLSINSYSQEILQERLLEYNENVIEEKIYLHTDRSYYGIGETIWYQAYLTIGNENKPSNVSSTAYIQLYNSSDNLVSEQVIRMNYGLAKGNINLDTLLAPGGYKLVAFTNWMKNFGPEQVFQKPIYILPTEIEELDPVIQQETNIDLQFFPEGGNLLDGIPTKVAFKAIGPDGLSRDVKGVIEAKKSGQQTAFETQHKGMGTVFMTPIYGEKYEATVEGFGTFKLPEVYREGISLRVQTLNDSTLKVSVFNKSSQSPNTKLQLNAHQSGYTFYSANFDANRLLTVLEIPTGELSSGLAKITVLNSKNKPLAERLVFVENDLETIQLSSNKASYNKREKVTLSLGFENMAEDSLSAMLSLNVLDIGQTIDKRPSTSIYANLLLTSELSGFIEQPTYYFDTDNEKRKGHLDLVMLTHGWRKYDWKNVLDQVYPNYSYEPERGVSVKGQMLRLYSKKKAVANSEISIVNQKNISDPIRVDSTDINGFFEINDLLVYNNDTIIFKGNRKKDKTDIRFVVDSSSVPIELTNSFKPQMVQEDLKSGINSLITRNSIDDAYRFLIDSTATLLDDVIVEGYAYAGRVEQKEALERTVWGRGDRAVDFNDPMFQGQFDPIAALRGKLPGLRIEGNAVAGYNIALRTTGVRQIPPLILLDDVPVNLDLLTSIPVDQIERVVAYSSLAKSAIFGADGAGGVLAFYRKQDLNLESKIEENGVLVTTIGNAYVRPDEFYAPKYDVKRPEHLKPDQRILLHWQPLLPLIRGEKQEVEFYATDRETTLLINVEGITIEGQPITKQKLIKVGQ